MTIIMLIMMFNLLLLLALVPEGMWHNNNNLSISWDKDIDGAREAGCFRELTALHSDHLRQVPP